MNPARVSVVVPCRNEARYIGGLLSAIADQDFPVSEVIIVDAESTDGTREAIAQSEGAGRLRALSIIDGPVGAIPVSLNRGIARTTGDVVVRFDAHSIPQPDYVRRSVGRLADPGVGVVGGLWNVAPGAASMVAHAIAVAASHPLAAGDAAYRLAARDSGVRDAESVPFGCYRRELWERLGGYTEDLQVAEDYEFNHRVRDLGLRVVLDTAMSSTYFARPTVGALVRQYYRYGWWKAEVIRRFPGSWRWRAFVPATFVASVASLAVTAPFLASARVAGLVLIGTYAITLLAGSCHACAKRGTWRLAPALPLVFAAIHVAQGAGVLANLLGLGSPADRRTSE